jgi:dihydrofolate reductase
MTPGSLPEGHVFIATSVDGFIARPDGGIDWLEAVPALEGEDFGYAAFMERMDGILMGANTLRVLLGFPDWPYAKPLTVLSRSLGPGDVPEARRGGVSFDGGEVRDVFARQGALGRRHLYVDGGRLIQSCLREGLIRSMTVTRIPVLLGEGIPLFGPTGRDVPVRLEAVRSWPNGFAQEVYAVA